MRFTGQQLRSASARCCYPHTSQKENGMACPIEQPVEVDIV